MRDLFWANVVREMLTGLSLLCQTQPELFDGRFSVLTHAGERIPIGQVFPLFACSMPTTDAEKFTSIAVQCTVFRIQTPSGEVFTLPIHEIRALHALTPQLIEQLQAAARSTEDDESDDTASHPTAEPFGLAAYVALPKLPPGPPPAHPME